MPKAAHILIATPTHDRKVTTDYLASVFGLQKQARRRLPDLELTLSTNSYASVDLARNVMASYVLEMRQFTHLLFVDADQGFSPDLVFDMLQFDRPVVSVVGPRRSVSFEQLWRKARQISSWRKLESLSLDYYQDFVTEGDNRIAVVEGFVKVRGNPTGVMLIKREVIERIAQLPGMITPDFEPLVADGLSGRLVQCFRPMLLPDNRMLGEDLSFCRRWTEDCGGEIWASVAHAITHVGTMPFKGRFADRFEGLEATSV
jgi:hypothetical protein